MKTEIKHLDRLHHFALPVSDIAQSVEWYTRRFSCAVCYQDATWALLEFANIHLALVLPDEHPAHVALARSDAETFGRLQHHRDGTRSVYISDPAGNRVEILALEQPED